MRGTRTTQCYTIIILLRFVLMLSRRAQKVYREKENLFAGKIIKYSDETKLVCLLLKIGLGLLYYSTQ